MKMFLMTTIRNEEREKPEVKISSICASAYQKEACMAWHGMAWDGMALGPPFPPLTMRFLPQLVPGLLQHRTLTSHVYLALSLDMCYCYTN